MRTTEIVPVIKNLEEATRLIREGRVGVGYKDNACIVGIENDDHAIIVARKGAHLFAARVSKEADSFNRVDVNQAYQGLLIGIIVGNNLLDDMEDETDLRTKVKDILKAENVSSSVSILKPALIEDGTFVPDTIIYGQIDLVVEEKLEKKETSKLTFGEFPIHPGRTLADKELLMVPKMDSYIADSDIRIDAKILSETKTRHLLLSGPSGTGKTEYAKALAYCVGLPYHTMVCSPDADTGSLFTQFIPETASNEGNEGMEEIVEHLQMFYDEQEVKNFQTCLNDVLAHVGKKVSDLVGGAKQQMFRSVESPIIEALRYGYLVEIQEPSVIKDPGVLTALNDLMVADTVCIPQTGERFKRHPDAVIVLTTNPDYEGCRPLNQSVISRCQIVRHVENLDSNELAERAFAQTSYDRFKVNSMAKAVCAIQALQEETGDKSAEVGLRELIDWINMTRSIGDIKAAGKRTVIAKTSMIDREARMSAMSILDQVYPD